MGFLFRKKLFDIDTLKNEYYYDERWINNVSLKKNVQDFIPLEKQRNPVIVKENIYYYKKSFDIRN